MGRKANLENPLKWIQYVTKTAQWWVWIINGKSQGNGYKSSMEFHLIVYPAGHWTLPTCLACYSLNVYL